MGVLKKLLLIAALLVTCNSCFGAFTEFYCQTTGSNLNAGSTATDAATLTYASGTWVVGTGVFTVASGDPASDGVAVGDWASVYPDAATVGVFVGRVTARDATTITVSLTAKSGTAPVDGTANTTLKIGGAWKGPNGTEDFPFGFIQNTMVDASANTTRVNMKTGTYSVTDGVTHGNIGPVLFQGYTSTVADLGRWTLDGGTSGAAYILLTLSAADWMLADTIVQNNGASSTAAGISASGARGTMLRVTANSLRGSGFNLAAGDQYIIECEAYSCNQSNNAGSAGFFMNTAGLYTFVRCVARDNTTSNTCGWNTATGNGRNFNAFYCIADSNGSHGMQMDSGQSPGTVIKNCDFYGNGGDGYRQDGGTGPNRLIIENCNFISNGGYAINRTDSASSFLQSTFNGFYSNTSGTINNFSTGLLERGSITYSSSPYVDGPNGNFIVNSIQAKGAARGAFGSFVTTVSYPDMGASQHPDAASPTIAFTSGQ